jgi:Phytanoyl-CoA dioxygenase (PhyH)
MNIVVDPEVSGEDLRQQLYAGSLVILTRLKALSDFVDYTREELTELFKPHDPEHVHEHVDPAEMAKILGVWKPHFIHAEKSRKLVRTIIQEAGFSAEDTHYDLPKPRTSFPAGHLTTGVAFAFPWHRDVWYSAPAQQINWWLPVFPVRADNAMSFDLQSFGREVSNNSGAFDYYQNNASRLTTAAQVTRERQARPGALDHRPSQELVLLPAPGEVLLFSGAQLHASIPNTSGRARFSVDFRTVDARDLMAGRGAPLVDVYCTGTAIRDFLNVADESAFEEQTVRTLFGAPPPDAMLVFDSPDAEHPAEARLSRHDTRQAVQ